MSPAGDLYGHVIRDRFRHPRFQGRIDAPDAVFEDVNPLCGDRVAVECRIADGVLADARHRGDSCAVCMASADVLLEMAIGRRVEDAAALGSADVLERLQADVRPSRLMCVALPITVLQGALQGREVAK